MRTGTGRAERVERADPWGRALQGLVVIGGGLVVGIGALAAVLAPFGWWRPWLVAPLVVVGTVALARLVRGWPAARVGAGGGVALVLVGVLFTGWVVATRSEQLLPRRDAGTYLVSAGLLAETGRRVVPLDLPAAVLAVPGVTAGSPGFAQVERAGAVAIEPQFVVGPAAGWSLGLWAGGPSLIGVAVLAALSAALALVGVGLLVARFVGPLWGVCAAAAGAVLFPVLHTARMPYSENLGLLALVAALLALACAPSRPTAAVLAGALLGGAGLVRVDALREVLLVLPVLALSALAGARWPARVAWWLAGSTTYAALAALALSRTYVLGIGDSVLPLVVLALVTALGCGWLVRSWRRGGLARPVLRRLASHGDALASTTAVLVAVGGVLLAARPLFWTGRQSPRAPAAYVVAGMQLREGLPVDGTRSYVEQTVGWLAWWVGRPALAVALVALAALSRVAVRRLASGQVPPWLAALVVAAGSSALTLARPGITPDHPWAERRLLVAFLLVVVLVVVAAAAAARWVRRRLAGRGRSVGSAATAGALAAVVACLAPAVAATWPHRTERVEAGSVALLGDLCPDLARAGVDVRDDLLVAADGRAANEWPPVLRTRCGAQVVALTSPVRKDPAARSEALGRLRTAAARSGLRVVVLTAEPTTDAALPPGTTVLDGTVLEDPRLLVHRPDALVPLRVVLRVAPLP